MSLTDRQKRLLHTMAEVHRQGCEEAFLFVATLSDLPSLVYPSPVGSIDVEGDDSDFLALESAGLITPLSRNRQGMLRAKPTTEGIAAVRRNFSDPFTRPNDEGSRPSLPVSRAMELLREQLQRADHIEQCGHDDPAIIKWENTTEQVLHAAYGKPDGEAHQNTLKYLHCLETTHLSRIQADHVTRTRHRKALLESFIEQLEILAPPATQTAFDQYSFHPDIEQVSGQLYRDGHFTSAALQAYIKVIDAVKVRAGHPIGNNGRPYDGDGLMHRAFGCDNNKTPLIQFNSLQIEAERDEQRGFLNLFLGIVGLRNSKAHSNRIFDDPRRAHEYLALASLLLRVLDMAHASTQPHP